MTGDGGGDTIDGGSGANYIDGGGGNDTLSVTESATHDALGSAICGGAGDDELTATGHGHVCLDGGGQGGDDCSYSAPVDSADVHDVGTAVGCFTTSGTFHSIDERPCPCG